MSKHAGAVLGKRQSNIKKVWPVGHLGLAASCYGAPWKLWCLGKADSGFFADRRMTEAEFLLF